jgi:hypothetical protein
MVNLLYLLKRYRIFYQLTDHYHPKVYCNRRQRLDPHRCTQMPRNIFKKDAKKRFVFCELNILYVPLLDRQLEKNAARLLTVQLYIHFMVFSSFEKGCKMITIKRFEKKHFLPSAENQISNYTIKIKVLHRARMH